MLWVSTPHGDGLALFLMDYGPHENTVWVVALESEGRVKHYTSEDIRICHNHTFKFNIREPRSDKAMSRDDFPAGRDPQPPQEKKPLLSDDDLRGMTRPQGIHYSQDGEYRYNRLMGADEIRDFYEAARAKDRELIQRAVDVAYRMLDPVSFAMTQARLPITEHEYRSALRQANAFLAAAKAAGFTPSTEPR